jgi:murein DD-endopeptidase MepM/ murein hydrolase activator NlpD
MTNTTSSISSVPNLSSGTNLQSKSTSSTSDIIASFKEIMSVMTAMNGLSSSNVAAPYQSAGMGMGTSMSDLMAPLMLLMLERLIEQQLDHEDPTATTAPASSAVSSQATSGGVYGSKPEPSGRPVDGGRISQGSRVGHNALDIAVPVGTSVKTTMDGKVIHAGWNDQGYGNLVIVENGEYRTYYAHLSSIPVAVGDTVAAGTVIGLSGNTGNSTGPHLHYEIRRNKVTIDPTAATLG